MPGPKVNGALPQDNNGIYMQIAARMAHKDGSEMPKISPLSAVGITPVEFVPPSGALNMFCRGRDAGIRIGDDDDLSDGYEALYQGEWSQPIPCSQGDSIYVRINAGEGTTAVDFRFQMLGET